MIPSYESIDMGMHRGSNMAERAIVMEIRPHATSKNCGVSEIGE
jgi:hypothetical protein